MRYLVAERSVVINLRRRLPVQADGEIIGDTPVTVEVVREAVRVIVPSAARSGLAEPVNPVAVSGKSRTGG